MAQLPHAAAFRPAAPALAALVAGYGRAAILSPDGELLTMAARDAAESLRAMGPPLLVHAPASFRRLGIRPAPSLDLLELFAFVMPGVRAAPTPRGLALALDIDPPAGLEAAAAMLPDLAAALLSRLAAGRSLPLNAHAAGVAARMGRAGWLWAASVQAALGSADSSVDGFKVWRRLPE